MSRAEGLATDARGEPLARREGAASYVDAARTEVLRRADDLG